MKDRPQIFVRPDFEAFAAELHCSDWRPLLEAENTIVVFSVSEYRWTLRSCFVHRDRIRRLSSPNLLSVDAELYTELQSKVVTPNFRSIWKIIRVEVVVGSGLQTL